MKTPHVKHESQQAPKSEQKRQEKYGDKQHSESELQNKITIIPALVLVFASLFVENPVQFGVTDYLLWKESLK